MKEVMYCGAVVMSSHFQARHMKRSAPQNNSHRKLVFSRLFFSLLIHSGSHCLALTHEKQVRTTAFLAGLKSCILSCHGKETALLLTCLNIQF
jgi:hypothetical protein